MVLGTPSPYKPPSRSETLAAAREDLESPLSDRLALRKALDAADAGYFAAGADAASPIKPPLLSSASSARMTASPKAREPRGLQCSPTRVPRVFQRSPTAKMAPPRHTDSPTPPERWEDRPAPPDASAEPHGPARHLVSAAVSPAPTATADAAAADHTPLSALHRSRQFELSKKLFPSQPVLVRSNTKSLQADADAAVSSIIRRASAADGAAAAPRRPSLSGLRLPSPPTPSQPDARAKHGLKHGGEKSPRRGARPGRHVTEAPLSAERAPSFDPSCCWSRGK